ADGYKPAKFNAKVTVGENAPTRLQLIADETPNEMLDRMIASLGGERALRTAVRFKSQGRMTLAGDPISIGNHKFDFSESLFLPDKLRWDLQDAQKKKWTVAANGAQVWSNGDKRYQETSALEFDSELEDSIRYFMSLRPQALLLALRVGFALKKERTAEGV